MARPRTPEQAPIVRGEVLDLIELVKRLPPASRPHILMEERERLMSQLAEINKLLEGEEVDERDDTQVQ